MKGVGYSNINPVRTPTTGLAVKGMEVMADLKSEAEGKKEEWGE